ncbi:hypothetical protein [Sabulicella rubraurantiaca]|uniref:hypothetical protein n=1 Tax=Sabulicella rubraurantiaca TaxID=2811429 RepID=UPI001A9698D6|nr:hypothetical protein [Sabulicella rubraurantiaca]
MVGRLSSTDLDHGGKIGEGRCRYVEITTLDACDGPDGHGGPIWPEAAIGQRGRPSRLGGGGFRRRHAEDQGPQVAYCEAFSRTGAGGQADHGDGAIPHRKDWRAWQR